MNPPPRRHRRESGSALIVALLSLVVISVLMVALMSTQVLGLNAVTSTARNSRAQTLADAGVEYVVGRIVRDGGAYTPGSTYALALPGGTFSAQLSNPGGVPTVNSLGTESSQGRRRRVEARLRIDSQNLVVSRQFGLFSCSAVTISGSSAVIDGDVYSAGDLEIEKRDAIQNGDAMAYGGISFKGVGSVTGSAISETGDIRRLTGNNGSRRVGGDAVNPAARATLNPGQVGGVISRDPARYTLPDYCNRRGTNTTYQQNVLLARDDMDAYKAAAQAAVPGGPPYAGANPSVSNGGFGGSPAYGGQHLIQCAAPPASPAPPAQPTPCPGFTFTINGTPTGFEFSGIYYVRGNLEVRGNYTGRATFIVEGDLIVNGNTSSGNQDANDHAYVVNGNVRFTGTASVDGTIYTNGAIQASGNTTINGSVIAMGSAGTTGSLTINYRRPDEDLELPNPVFQSLSVARWRMLAP